MSKFPAVFNLTSLNGNNGFVIKGIIGDQTGLSVSGAGDVNGDGIADIIIGALGTIFTGVGKSYVIFGNKSGFTTPFNLASLNGNNGFAINGINGGTYGDDSGSDVSEAGDVNGDGIADIIIGRPTVGQSYVIFGSKSGFNTPFDLTDLNGNNGFAINSTNDGYVGGGSVSGAGDVNGDGIADIIIGQSFFNGVGQSYVVFGSRKGFTTPFNLTDLNGNNGFAINLDEINGASYSAIPVSGAGDANGDGIADIIIGRPVEKSYVVFGSKNGFTTPFNITYLNGTNGFAINGFNDGFSEIGNSVSGAGDINGDGIADIIIGNPATDPYVNNGTGQSYVIFGSKSGFTTPFSLANLNGNNGFAINGINFGDQSGGSVSGAGDINGDGIADIVIGAPNANNQAGQSYVVFGSKSGFTTPFNLTGLNGNNGFAINGINGGQNHGDQSGWSVSGAGDVNGDGIADIIIGAPGAGNIGEGASYVIFGSKSGFTTPFNLTDLSGANADADEGGLGL